MLFNSIQFLFFLPIVFAIYWALHKNMKGQNFFLLVVSYVFYGWWDVRFLSLIAFSSLLDFFIALRLDKTENPTNRKVLLWTSLVANLGLLFFFKYANFFIESLQIAFQSIGIELHLSTLQIILPVGISFYTFQTLSYTIDVYRRTMKATSDWVDFLAYVSFFPQLVAGPIERAAALLPQFQVVRRFSYELASDGMRQILWGCFKKMVIADNAAFIVDNVYKTYQSQNAATLVLTAILFSFQIYGDFSGYSDIAIGTSKLFGFRLMRNFELPYFSRDIAEFWRRWHISLTTWFRDYLYFPIGGSRVSKLLALRNTFIVFLVSGFWHGANWTFIIWGGLNAVLFIPLLLTNRNRRHLQMVAENALFPTFKEFYSMLFTFVLVTIAWVFFRAPSVAISIDFLSRMLQPTIFNIPAFPKEMATIFPLIGSMVLVEWWNRKREHPLEIGYLPAWMRHLFYIAFLAAIFIFGRYNATSFIYFQF